MTKKEARAIARAARRWGHGSDGRSAYVFCPICRSRIETMVSGPWCKVSTTGRLDAAVLEHLEESHNDT